MTIFGNFYKWFASQPGQIHAVPFQNQILKWQTLKKNKCVCLVFVSARRIFLRSPHVKIPSRLEIIRFKMSKIWILPYFRGSFASVFSKSWSFLEKYWMESYNRTFSTGIQKEFWLRICLVELWPFQTKMYLAKFPLSQKTIFPNCPPRSKWRTTEADVSWPLGY